MLQKVYLAECSDTYRQLLLKILSPFGTELVDLWSNPEIKIEENPDCMVIVDEAFLAKGPGPARFYLCALFTEGRITQNPLLLLERREKLTQFRYNSRILKLRRPFLIEDIVKIFSQLGLQAEFKERELSMSENITPLDSVPEVEEIQAEPVMEASVDSVENAESLENLEAQAPVESSEVLETLETMEMMDDSEAISSEVMEANESRKVEEIILPENPILFSEDINLKIEQAIKEAISQSNLTEKAQEILEKAIRETVPSIAEKLIKEEIERLTR